MSVVELTQDGRDWMRSKQPLELTRPVVLKSKSSERRPRSERAGEIKCDEMLFERLREFRLELAAKRGVPAYVVFGDVALREMARDCPATMEAFDLISGVGDKKKAEYGKIFISEIAAYLEEKG
jgi:ATP-dependent DNA helicase RecQ